MNAPSARSAGDDVARLRAALDGLAEALAHGDLDGVLGAEPVLSEAVDILQCARHTRADAALVAEIDGARRALLRCRRLGASLSDIARIAAGPEAAGGYGRDGGHTTAGQAATMGARG